jgi:hypothetical protein
VKAYKKTVPYKIPRICEQRQGAQIDEPYKNSRKYMQRILVIQAPLVSQRKEGVAGHPRSLTVPPIMQPLTLSLVARPRVDAYG